MLSSWMPSAPTPVALMCAHAHAQVARRRALAVATTYLHLTYLLTYLQVAPRRALAVATTYLHLQSVSRNDVRELEEEFPVGTAYTYTCTCTYAYTYTYTYAYTYTRAGGGVPGRHCIGAGLSTPSLPTSSLPTPSLPTPSFPWGCSSPP